MKSEKKDEVKMIASNRKAHHKFHILESLEAGISLLGHEVKSLRSGHGNIQEALVRIQGDELFLFNAHISPYKHLSTHLEADAMRTRKLLLHRKEINQIISKVQTQGLVLVPLELYFKRGKVKLSIGLSKGKKMEDRREEIKKRDIDRNIRTKLYR